MTSQKRKANYSTHIHNSPPSKKVRHPENNNHSSPAPKSTHPNYQHQQSKQDPPLPEILPEYENVVFTHSSLAVQEPNSSKMVNYERLEFLGDAQIEHIASLVLWDRFPSALPKRLSTMRESLVRNETLYKFAKMYRFDTKLQSTLTVNNHNQHRNEPSRDLQKIYADVFEAYVAAVILSDTDYFHGFTTVRTWLTELWEPVLRELDITAMNPKLTDNKSKEALSKMVLMPGVRLSYVDEKPTILNRSSGVSTYFIGVYLDGLGFDNQYLGSGTGDSKNMAGQEAAKNALKNPLIGEITQRRAQLLEQKKSEEENAAALQSK